MVFENSKSTEPVAEMTSAVRLYSNRTRNSDHYRNWLRLTWVRDCFILPYDIKQHLLNKVNPNLFSANVSHIRVMTILSNLKCFGHCMSFKTRLMTKHSCPSSFSHMLLLSSFSQDGCMIIRVD